MSITSSYSGPFNGLLLQDVVFNVSASWPSASVSTSASVNVGVFAVSASTPNIYYPNLDFPTVGQFVVQVYTTALTNSSGSVTSSVRLQESKDGNSWNDVSVFSSTLCSTIDNGALASPAVNTYVLLAPNAKPYLRATATVPATGSTYGGVTGSFGINTLF
jgi:hypothetical protein